jgi:hypothetical protein
MIHRRGNDMPRLLHVRVCLAMALLGLAACARLPPDYSPHYSYIPVASPGRPDRVRYVLVPDACLVPDATDTLLGPRLPPGCANAYNLERMAERQHDLVEGRQLGPAPALPSARAAQRYIYGPTGPLGAGVGTPGNPVTPTSTTEPAPVRN